MASVRTRQHQQEIRTRKRRGAGRNRKRARRRVPHRTRPFLDGRTPVHITLRMLPAIATLRKRDQHRAIRMALAVTAARSALRICQYSVQANHVHLIAEPNDRATLTSGMISFKTSCARRLNRAQERRGRVFADRYHARQLRSPEQVRRALVYCLNDWRRHGEDLRHPEWRTDRFSSADFFDGWSELVGWHGPPGPIPVVPAEMSRLTTGWLRHGAIDPIEVPGLGKLRPSSKLHLRPARARVP
jgi:REP element-mobilizing transposase RayT